MCRVIYPNGKRIILVLFLLLLGSSVLFALGKKEEEKLEEQYTEFLLCITSFDVSELPPAQQILGSIIQKELVMDLGRIHHRNRNDDEISRYEELAVNAALSRAATDLSAKREERDALLFQGTPEWKYKKELKRINEEIRELETAYKKAEEEKPLIAEKPLFTISEMNTAGDFPLPPQRGGEEAFLRANNADAFLEGKFRLLYGRVYAEFRFFTRGASFVYEDSTIFSQEDLNAAADELKSRFLAALVNSEPARILLTAEPDYARLELNGRLVKSGEAVELPPGPVSVRASADDYQEMEKELELEGGDTEEVAFVLRPLTMETLGINLNEPGMLVYMGAMYLGGNAEERTKSEEQKTNNAEDEAEEAITTAEDNAEAAEIAEAADTVPEANEEAGETEEAIVVEIRPGFFSVYVPIGQYRYIRVETEDGLTGEAIVKGSSAEDGTRIITLQPRKLPGKDEKPVEDKRRKFYGAYGRFWVALPVAFLITGFYQGYLNSYNLGAYSGKRDMYNDAKTSYYVTIGAWAVAGIFLTETLIRMGVYIHSASKEAIPLWE